MLDDPSEARLDACISIEHQCLSDPFPLCPVILRVLGNATHDQHGCVRHPVLGLHRRHARYDSRGFRAQSRQHPLDCVCHINCGGQSIDTWRHMEAHFFNLHLLHFPPPLRPIYLAWADCFMCCMQVRAVMVRTVATIAYNLLSGIRKVQTLIIACAMFYAMWSFIRWVSVFMPELDWSLGLTSSIPPVATTLLSLDESRPLWTVRFRQLRRLAPADSHIQQWQVGRFEVHMYS